MRTWQDDYPILFIPFFISSIVFASPFSYSRPLRENFLDLCITPIVTSDQAQQLQQSWLETSLTTELLVGLLIALNAALPVFLVVYVLIEILHKSVRYKKVTQLHSITDQFQRR